MRAFSKINIRQIRLYSYLHANNAPEYFVVNNPISFRSLKCEGTVETEGFFALFSGETILTLAFHVESVPVEYSRSQRNEQSSNLKGRIEIYWSLLKARYTWEHRG